jgi:molybdenum cofactor cytidylyltransferase
MTVAAVVLAAGRSTRAGATNKLTAAIAGVPMVARVVDAVLGAPVRPIIVVTGHEASAVRTSLAGRDVTFVHNPDFADGMATSIRAGVAALPEEASAVVICLGDMPALASEDIARLLAAFETGGADICVPVAGERRGNPALFARRFFPELQVLSGDTGARGLIAAHADQVREVRMEGVGILTDLDTEADIDAYNRTQNQ